MTTETPTRRRFGQVRRLPSGRYQARWRLAGRWYTARRDSDGGPQTFTTAKKAEAHLAWVRVEIEAGRWAPPDHSGPVPTFATYAETWLAGRDLATRTRDHYRQLLDAHILPTFGAQRLDAITPAHVRAWHASLLAGRPTLRAHAYGLLRAICTTATVDDAMTANPCRVRGASTARRASTTTPATLDELATIVEAMPPRLRLAVDLSAWCALRFGEVVALRRMDVEPAAGLIHVRRSVARTSHGVEVKEPKTAAGLRTVHLPPHLTPALEAHLATHTQPGKTGLLFPAASGGYLAPATVYGAYYPARNLAGRPDLRWHDLRHTGAVLAASTGATLADLMGRLGHASPRAAMRYQHAAEDRDRQLAANLSGLAGAVPFAAKAATKGSSA